MHWQDHEEFDLLKRQVADLKARLEMYELKEKYGTCRHPCPYPNFGPSWQYVPSSPYIYSPSIVWTMTGTGDAQDTF